MSDDTSREGEETPYGTLTKMNGKRYDGSPSLSPEERHDDSVAACVWMQAMYDTGLIDDAWIVFAHIERRGDWSGGGYNIEHFRDFNNAAPDICIGFEGAPGHQASGGRGGFGGGAYGQGTYGGTGYYTATVGHLWDALLGEGRRWFNFASSDKHKHWTVGGGDFFPGEYQKTWSYVSDSDGYGDYSMVEIAQSLRSGNSYHVMGDLVDFLEFTAQSKSQKVPMGGEMFVDEGGKLKLKIKFSSPRVNNNGDVPVVDHIDLIAGAITGKVAPEDPGYTNPVNPTTKVIATFSSPSWEADDNGCNVVVYQLDDLDVEEVLGIELDEVPLGIYFRLRGTNMPPGTPHETDENGNPLADSEATEFLGLDRAAEAWADLWFYSNPIFVYVIPNAHPDNDRR